MWTYIKFLFLTLHLSFEKNFQLDYFRGVSNNVAPTDKSNDIVK